MYRAMIVDDEPLFLEFLRQSDIWSRFDVKIEAAFQSGRQAADWLNAGNSVELILTDAKMPVISGIDFIGSIPASLRERMYIIVLSGYEDYDIVRKAFLSGADDYLLKVDFMTSEFEKAMEKAVNRLNEMYCPKTPILSEMTKYIAENLDKPLTLNKLAARFGYSPGYLSQLFSRKMQITLSDYISKERVKKAQYLLRNTDISITMIGDITGFNSIGHFSHVFTKEAGCSPSAYRNKKNNRN